MVTALNKSAIFTCSHGGTGTISSAGTSLQGSNDPIVTQSEFMTMTITSCTNIGFGLIPCTAIASLVSGISTTLFKGGAPVILSTFVCITNSTPPGSVSASSVQTTCNGS